MIKTRTNGLCKIFLTTLSFACFSALATVPAEQTKSEAQPLPLQELRAFSEVFYYVKSTYVEEVDDQTLINAAIKGMVSSLDNHSKYLDPKAFANFTADNDGEYAGIGLSFNDHTLGIEISEIVKNSPADRKNLSEGMIVTKINGINIQQISSEDAFKLIRGKINSTITLTVISPSVDNSGSNERDYSLVREVIILPSVDTSLLPNNVGYLAIEQFTKKTPMEFIEAMETLSSTQPLTKLILDLRNNLGGALESSIAISDLFIDSGVLLTSSGRTYDANEVYKANASAPYSNLKVVVLMNEYTASSSEILAAALHDHEKATLLGRASYGKGSIQTIYVLQQASGLKLTTAKYFSPNGHEIQDVGLQPDVKFKLAGLSNSHDDKLLNDLELLQAYNLVQTL